MYFSSDKTVVSNLPILTTWAIIYESTESVLVFLIKKFLIESDWIGLKTETSYLSAKSLE